MTSLQLFAENNKYKERLKLGDDKMALINKEAEVCNYLNKYLEQEVKKLAKECDSNWLIHDRKVFTIARQNDIKEKRNVIVYPQINIKSILFCKKDIYFVPKFVKQENVHKYVKQINKECKKIVKEFTEYDTTVNNNINMLKALLDDC